MKKIINYLISLTNREIFVLLRNLLELFVYKKKFTLFYKKDFYIRKYYDFKNIYFCHKERTRMYGRGYKFRLKSLEKIYFMDDINFTNSDTIIDCGSNVGEIGLIFKLNKKFINYIAFEPSQLEFLCLKKNNPENRKNLHNVALWKSNSNLNFYYKSQTADSSLFKTKDFDFVKSIKCKKLDDYNFNRKIKLLKVEAEGAEPEVLKGAKMTINYCEYIAVDAGPERGIKNDTTVKEVKQFLLQRNFILLRQSHERIILLFRNRRFL